MSFLSSQCNYQPCSQSQKMSIGIVVDSVPTPRNGSRREDDVSRVHGEKEVSNVEQVMGKPKLQRGVKASSTVTMRNNDVQEGSVRVAARSLGAKLPVKNNEHIENQAVRPARTSLQGKQPASITQSFVNEASLGPDVAKKPAAERAAGKENRRPSNDDVSEKFSCGPKQKVCLPEKEVLQEQPNELENSSKEALRMKLREILGNVASGNNILDNSRTPEVKANEMVNKQTAKGDSHSKPRQNSDTIETDSENGEDVKVKRPVTRSLTRRKAPTRKRLRNSKPKSLSSDKKDHQGGDIFSFADKTPPLSRAVNCDNPKVKKYVRAKKSCSVKSRETLSPVAGWRNTQLEKTGCDKAPPVEEVSLGGGATSPKHGTLNANDEPEAAMQDTNGNQSFAARGKNQQADVKSPTPQEKPEHLKPFDRQSPVPHVDVLDSIWFKWTKDAPNSPMRSYPQTHDKGQGVHGYAQPEGGILPKSICLSKSSTTSEKDNSESSEDATSLKNARFRTPESSTGEEDHRNGKSTPVRGEPDSTEEVSSAKKVYPEEEEEDEEEKEEEDEEEKEEEKEEDEEEEDEKEEEEDVHTSSEIRVARKPRLFRSKRHCNHDDFSTFTPTLPTPKESGNADDALTECLDESPEDGLSRVVSLLGLALEKVKNKLMLVTNKKCSEILVSAAGEIQSQLQNVETQIQTDLGKLTSLKTTKRKHVEIRLQEQQEHLKRMHEKFKEEISQYLQDCKGAMEGLETQHIELQRAIEKQKASHKKLLSQTEAAVETHLTDAQKQMMIVRKLGKKKMQQLKVIIAECLKDGISR